MKHPLKFLPGIIATFGFLATAHAATLTRAEITWIVKDVRTIDPSRGIHPATPKETLQGEQSLRTGIDSRTELLFNDHTITRLGANTHFSFSKGTRNMSLDSGAMLLQVPKGIGGAQIEMSAVTAGVTGTTIMLDREKTYTKLIVLEGECCLWLNPGKRHKVCAKAGQEIIVRAGATTIPAPVFVNLKIIEQTSRLLTGRWGTPLDQRPIIAARNAQGPGLTPTNSTVTGAGTATVITQQLAPQTPPTTPQGGGGNPARSAPPATVVTPPTTTTTGPNGPFR